MTRYHHLITDDNRKWWTLGAMCFALFMIMLDNTVVNVALPSIQKDLGASISGLEWTINGYTLSFAVLLATGGRLGDIFGRRRMFLAGVVIFAITSATAGFAPNQTALVISRVVQGVGAALMMPATLSIITNAFPPEERGKAMGTWAGVSALALAVGPVLGGFLTEHVSWRAIFYINIPVAIGAVVATLFAVRESRDTSVGREVDFAGVAVLTGSLTALILALVAGAVVGLALGALGGGGSVLAVPALIYLLGFTPAAATTAGLLIVTATSLTALYAHARTGNVRWKAGTLFAAAGLLPAAAAGAAAARLPEPVLTAAFAAVAALAAVTMLRPGRPAAGPGADGVRPARAAGTGAGLGALTGLLGVGGGFLAVPALVTVLAFEMQAAVGTSLLVISANSLASLTTRGATTAGIDWAVIGPFTGAAILGAWDGKRLAAKVTGGLLRRAFAVTLLAVAAFMLADALT